MDERYVVVADRIVTRHGTPTAQALLIEDGTVVGAGTPAEFDADILAFPGATVLPSFVDAHQHAYLVTVDGQSDSLLPYDSALADLLAAVARMVTAAETSEDWLRFHGYRPLHLDVLRSPTASELDAVCADRPLHLISRTYHESVVNSAGLDRLGITATTPDPPGGRIVRDRRGIATGVLLEAASFMAEAASRAAVDAAGWMDRLQAYGRLLASLGVTHIGDAAVPVEAVETLTAGLDESGVSVSALLIGARIDEPALVAGMTAKVLADGGEYCHLCFTGKQMPRLMRNGVRAGFGSDRALATAVGRRTGWPRRAAGAWHTGLRLTDDAGLDGLVHHASQIGSGLAVHAIGNGAVNSVVEAVARMPHTAGVVPLRVEHAMVLDAALAGGLATSGVQVVVQPGMLTAFGVELTRSPVPAPLMLLPLRTLAAEGAPMAFSSDFPAADLNPWRAVTDAVLRRDQRGDAIHPEESLTLVQALRAATEGASSALGLGGGTLQPGASADFVVVDKDPYAIEPDQLMSIRTLATYRAGRRTFAA